MNTINVIKRVDSLGRIVLPKNIRKNLELKENDEVELIIADNNEIILRKHSKLNKMQKEYIKYTTTLAKYIPDSKVLLTDGNKVVFCSDKKDNEKYKDMNISKTAEKFIYQRKNISIKTVPTFNILDSAKEKEYYKIMIPIICESDIAGALIVYSSKEISNISERDIELVKYTAKLIELGVEN